MNKIYKIDFENGYYLFKLEKVLYDKNISINKIMRDTNTDFKVIKRLSTGDLERIDITVVARLCDYLDCEMEDIFEYVKEK
jgi:putative transcriptional regulator